MKKNIEQSTLGICCKQNEKSLFFLDLRCIEEKHNLIYKKV